MIDTNILISALLFPSEKMNQLFETITVKHTMVLSSYVIDELHEVVERKFPTKIEVIEDLLSRMSYELVYTPKQIKKRLVEIRDVEDYPIIHTAIIEDTDILLTGDKDFEYIDIERPEILTPNKFLEKYR
ncbi:MAG: putative toxin-antitoxin system toxin component, PIN family [Clostridia bacterium]|nr:putative toxin-antitoxin system toxin component, PIN family [Clostridia bacterium]